MKLRGVLATAVAMSFGLLVLVGYFVNLGALREALLGWAVTLAGMAVFLGIINLFAVHAGKVRAREKNWAYSLLLIGTMLMTLLVGLVFGPQHPVVLALFKAVQLPVEASLLAVLTVTFVYASIRLLRRGVNLFAVVFLTTAILTLLGAAALPWVGYIPYLGDYLRPMIAQVFAAGGARGLLIGVALGALTTGLRVLFGVDRPYEGR